MYELWRRFRERTFEAKKQIKTSVVRTTKEEEKQIDPAEIDAYFDACTLIGFQKLDFKDIKVHDPLKTNLKAQVIFQFVWNIAVVI